MWIFRAIAIAMPLMTVGTNGRITGKHAWRTGMVMVILGGVLPGFTRALGG
jgi:hypothetical protein